MGPRSDFARRGKSSQNGGQRQPWRLDACSSSRGAGAAPPRADAARTAVSPVPRPGCALFRPASAQPPPPPSSPPRPACGSCAGKARTPPGVRTTAPSRGQTSQCWSPGLRYPPGAARCRSRASPAARTTQSPPESPTAPSQPASTASRAAALCQPQSPPQAALAESDGPAESGAAASTAGPGEGRAQHRQAQRQPRPGQAGAAGGRRHAAPAGGRRPVHQRRHHPWTASRRRQSTARGRAARSRFAVRHMVRQRPRRRIAPP